MNNIFSFGNTIGEVKIMTHSLDAKIENKTTSSPFNSSELNLSPMDKDKKLNRPLKNPLIDP